MQQCTGCSFGTRGRCELMRERGVFRIRFLRSKFRGDVEGLMRGLPFCSLGKGEWQINVYVRQSPFHDGELTRYDGGLGHETYEGVAMTAYLKQTMAAVLLVLAAWCHLAYAQNYPTKPVHIIVPFPPG